MSQSIPSIEPAVITAGDTITWSRSLPDYPGSGGWVLNYALRGPTAIDITAAVSGNDHLVSIGPTESTGYVAGVYAFQAYVSNGSDRVTISTGSITIMPDIFAQGAGYDGRSHVKRTLDAIEAVIEGRASKGDQEKTVDGVRLVKMTAGELLELRTRYQNEYHKELQLARGAQGKNSGRKIVTRFKR